MDLQEASNVTLYHEALSAQSAGDSSAAKKIYERLLSSWVVAQANVCLDTFWKFTGVCLWKMCYGTKWLFLFLYEVLGIIYHDAAFYFHIIAYT